eukprot:TRINITY_DN47267_c0_g1_i1.p1 TRINITY_DN47267_c0_g1~~TRINITY_DN47267_c0_g1_i1.p1  ORF type:complete len:328 (+),score=49.22 TRINITY_DN47267_c0_g1_i1:32-985(+)
MWVLEKGGVVQEISERTKGLPSQTAWGGGLTVSARRRDEPSTIKWIAGFARFQRTYSIRHKTPPERQALCLHVNVIHWALQSAVCKHLLNFKKVRTALQTTLRMTKRVQRAFRAYRFQRNLLLSAVLQQWEREDRRERKRISGTLLKSAFMLSEQPGMLERLRAIDGCRTEERKAALVILFTKKRSLLHRFVGRFTWVDDIALPLHEAKDVLTTLRASWAESRCKALLGLSPPAAPPVPPDWSVLWASWHPPQQALFGPKPRQRRFTAPAEGIRPQVPVGRRATTFQRRLTSPTPRFGNVLLHSTSRFSLPLGTLSM